MSPLNDSAVTRAVPLPRVNSYRRGRLVVRCPGCMVSVNSVSSEPLNGSTLKCAL